MCPAWRPAQQPPQLDRFCHLSRDAQLVMTALHSDYQQRRNEILKRQQQFKDPRSYYQLIYSARFGSSENRSFHQPSPKSDKSDVPSQNAGILSTGRLTNTLMKQSTCLSSVSKFSDSPPIETQDYRTLSQLQRIPTLSLVEREISPYCASQSLFTPESSVYCAQSESGEKLDFDKNIEFCNFHVYSDFKAVKSDKLHYDETTMDGSETTSHVEMETGLSNGNTRTTDKSDFQYMDDTGHEFLHNCVNKSCRDIRDTGSKSVHSHQKPSICRSHKDEDENEDPLKSENKQKKHPEADCHQKSEKTLFEIFNKPVQSKKTVLSVMGNSNRLLKSLQEGTVTVTDPHKRENCQKSFSAPYKKARIDRSKLTEEGHVSLAAAGFNAVSASGLVDVSTISADRWSDVQKEVLSSVEVILTLMYTNGASELRENLFGQENKKTGVAKATKGQSVVNALAVMCHSNSQTSKEPVHVYVLPIHQTSQQFYLWSKQFWEEVLNKSSRKVCLNAKSLFIQVLKSYNFDYNRVNLNWTVFDPSVAHWLLDSDVPVSSFIDLLRAVDLPAQNPDNGGIEALKEDMSLLGVLMERLYTKLKNKDLLQLFLCVETKLTPLLAAMELRQISVSTKSLIQFSDILKKKLSKLEKRAHQEAGHAFAINSHPQLRQVLFEELKLDSKLPDKTRLAKTSVGHQTSTSEAVLTQISPYHPLPGLVLEYRQLQKLKSTYIDGILSCVEDGHICSHWDQIAAATGRLASNQPNLQAIPKVPVTLSGYSDNYIVGKDNDDTIDIYARDAFICRDGWSFLSADFQQIELRLLAHLTDDPLLLSIFINSNCPDIFNELTSQWLGKSLDNITSVEREQTKRVVYSVMYGVGKDKLAEYLKISANDAKSIMDSFLLKFPAVSQFNKTCIEFCRRHGYTHSIFRRQRIFPKIKHPSPVLRAQAERQAVNFCVQGSAADICKAAMLQIEHELYSQPHIQARLLVQIHDELLLEVADSDLQTVTALVKTVMESREGLCGGMVSLKVPIQVSLSIGKTWGHVTPV